MQRIERSAAPETTEKHERGVTEGRNAAGVVVRLDVQKGALRRNDDDVIALSCQQDPLTPGLVAVDDAGQRALVLAARAPHGDPQLVLVDLAQRSQQVVRSFEGPGWLCGGFAGSGAAGAIVVVEQRLGDAPRFSVLVLDQGANSTARPVWSIEAMAQPSIPVAIDDDVVALVAVTNVAALTQTGDRAVIALDLKSGALAVLSKTDGDTVRVERSGEEVVVVVDGGRERLRIVLSVLSNGT